MQQTLDTWDKALSAIPQDVKEYRICKEILEGLYANRLYLDPKLSLTKFCSIVGTNTTYLSNAVNRCFGCNLKYLINWYRVQYAKALLSEARGKARSLPAACGFASKSAFYASFKQMEGMTPLQYRALRLGPACGGKKRVEEANGRVHIRADGNAGGFPSWSRKA